MRNVRVPLYGTPAKSAVIDPNATAGATVGKDLRWTDGSIVKESEIRSTSSAGDFGDFGTTDDLDEGGYNLYFTTPRAILAAGSAFIDSGDIDFTFDSDALSISAELTDTGVSAGGYGSPAPSLVAFQVDAKGRLLAASQVALVAGNGISFDTDPDTGSITISVNSFVNSFRITQDGSTRTTRDGNFRVIR